MAKKRKLNSNNPRYNKAEDNAPKVLKKKLMCNAKVRDVNGNVVERQDSTSTRRFGMRTTQ